MSMQFVVDRALLYLEAHAQITATWKFLGKTGWGRRAILKEKTRALILHDRTLRGQP